MNDSFWIDRIFDIPIRAKLDRVRILARTAKFDWNDWLVGIWRFPMKRLSSRADKWLDLVKLADGNQSLKDFFYRIIINERIGSLPGKVWPTNWKEIYSRFRRVIIRNSSPLYPDHPSEWTYYIIGENWWYIDTGSRVISLEEWIWYCNLFGKLSYISMQRMDTLKVYK